MTERGCMHDHDRLSRSLALYDQAREAWADGPTEGRQAVMDAERATLAVRAHYCGWLEKDGDVIAWARHRVATYNGLTSQQIVPEGAAVASIAIGLIERAFRDAR